MKRLWLTIAAIAALVMLERSGDALAAAANEEDRLIQILRSEQSPEEKDAACVRLHRVGTARAVPALAALLGDPRLSHVARYALESMPSPVAGRALTDALETTSGAERLGIVGSLGVRREASAVPALARWLEAACRAGAAERSDAGEDWAGLGAAAAAALGEMDRPEALVALEAAWSVSAVPLRDAVVDGLLRWAQRKLVAGAGPEARRVFAQIHEREVGEQWRMVAFQGMVRASGDDGLRLLIAALAGPSVAAQQAALRLVPDLPVAGATPAFAKLLPTLSPPLQVALLNGWMQRPDLPSGDTVAPLLHSPSPEVRLAAIRALGGVGDDRVVLLLVEAAAEAGPAQKAARVALTQLSRGEVPARLLALLDDPRSAVQVEAARALGERGERRAVAKLLDLARVETDAVRLAALRALVVLLDEPQLGALVRLVSEAAGETRRAEAGRALTLAYERLAPQSGSPALQPLLRGLADGRSEVRVALLAVCGSIATAEIRDALRAALKDPNAEIRAAAVRAASRSADPALLPDLTQLASAAAEEEFRDLATQAGVRLVTRPGGKLSAAERVEVFRTIASGPTSLAQKRALLLGLTGGRTTAELELAVSFLTDEAVRAEVAAALVKIAPRVADAAPAIAALQRVRAVTTDGEMRKEIEAALKAVESRAGFVTSWQSAAPFRVTGRSAPDLLEETFAPETTWGDFREPAARSRLARWEPMAVGTDAKYSMRMRGGDATLLGVVYAYTWLRSPREESVRLEIEHDEGIKVWLNGRVVLCGAGGGPPPKAEADRVGVVLKSGWNLLLLKIAQPEKSWSFAVRLKRPDGSPLEEVVVDAVAGPGP